MIEKSPFFIKSESKLVSVKPEEIIYIQAMGYFCKLKLKAVSTYCCSHDAHKNGIAIAGI